MHRTHSAKPTPQGSKTTGPYVARPVSYASDGGYTLALSVLFWLIFYLNLPDNLNGYAGNGGEVETANSMARNIKVGMIILSVYLIASRWSALRLFAKNINVGAAVILLLAPLSALWSIDPSATLLRFVSLASIVLVCVAACVNGWHRRRFQQLALPPLMFILIASLVVGIALPDRITEIGTDLSQKDAWHGITHGKNEFGMIASFGTIICFNSWLAREGRGYWAFAGSVVSVVCLMLSRSNTSQFATLVGVGSMALLMRVSAIRQRHATIVVLGLAATILLYELAIQDVIPGVNTLLAPIMTLTGKDATFSARTFIWKIIKDHIQGAPYLGTGYGAYWLGPLRTSPSYIFVSLMYFYPMEAHNGYLDMVNDLGMLGLVCLLLFLFWYMRQALQLLRIDPTQAALYIGLLLQEMVINMSESDWLSRTNTFAVLLFATACLSRGLLESPPRMLSVNAFRK
jgi:O-antigen ligase